MMKSAPRQPAFGLVRLGFGLGVALAVPALPAATVFQVTSTADAGAGTLREAIVQANASPNNGGNDRIEFNLPGTGVRSLAPVSALPAIEEPVDVDGTTQPGFTGTPLVELNGAGAGATTTGLILLTSNCTVRGLAINHFRDLGLRLEGFGGHTIQGNMVGTDATGTTALGNVNGGLLIFRSALNLIGGTNAADRNVFSGNAGTGIYLLDSGTRSNRIEGNFVGTSRSGSSALPNGTNGIVLYNAPNNVIGGTTPAARNVISGNQRSGIYVTEIFGSSAGNVIQGNYIGTTSNGLSALPNTADGVTLANAQQITVGGTNAGAGNLISGNGERGVLIVGSGARHNWILGNRIGTDATGRGALGNAGTGVGIDRGATNVIGGRLAAARNVIAGNRQSGVQILTATASGNRIEGNFIGVDLTGTNALGNHFNGLTIDDAPANTIGGADPGAGNVISGNDSYGLHLTRAGAQGNVVAGNFIGTDSTGLRAAGNAWAGLRLESPGNRIGGTTAAERNLISGNGDDGILLVDGARSNVVQGNFIGTDLSGARALRNGRGGIGIAGGVLNVIGGRWSGAGNVVSANGDPARADSGAGIYLLGTNSAFNTIQGNRIGTDVTGTAALGNYREGIYLVGAPSNQIGGATAELGNVISANRLRGIRLTNAWWNLMHNNLIGTAQDGVSNLGNVQHSIELEEGSSRNTIGGGLGLGNVIAYAQSIYAGIRVRDTCYHNFIGNNAIFSNGGLGIDLGGYQVSPNDPCDGDNGANRLQNFPTLNAAYSGHVTLVRGQLNSAPNQTYRVQFFASPTCDPLGHGEGSWFLGETLVTTPANCGAGFEVTLPVTVTNGHVVTATATDDSDNTSEFCACLRVETARLTAVPTPAAGGGLTLRWPTNAAVFQLQQTASLSPPVQWTPATNAPVLVSNGQYTVSYGATNGPRFFRLSLEPLP